MREAGPHGRAVVVAALLGIGCVHTKSTVPFHEEEFKDPYWALIYVYREEGGAQTDRSWGVFLDENVVGRLRQGAYFTFHAPPGTHSLYVGGNASRPGSLVPLGGLVVGGLVGLGVGYAIDQSQESQIKPKEFKAKSGEIYYLRCKGVERGFMTREQAIGTLRTMKYDQGD